MNRLLLSLLFFSAHTMALESIETTEHFFKDYKRNNQYPTNSGFTKEDFAELDKLWPKKMNNQMHSKQNRQRNAS
jgi:hypothetical protein